MLLILIANPAWSWLMFFTGRSTFENGFRTCHNLISIVILTLFRLFFKRYTPQSWILSYLAIHIFVYLAFTGFLPSQDTAESLTFYEDLWLYFLFFHILGNYNTFLLSVLTVPVITLGFLYLQLQIQMERQQWNSYSGEKLSEASDTDVRFWERIKGAIVMVILYVAHTYLV
jgi:hypothetical protein